MAVFSDFTFFQAATFLAERFFIPIRIPARDHQARRRSHGLTFATYVLHQLVSLVVS